MRVEPTADRCKGVDKAGRRYRLPGIFRRSVAHAASEDLRSDRLRRLGDVCVVLEAARGIIERGWLQGTWSVPGAACLVGAVVQVTSADDPAAGLIDAAPALDLLWDAWQESRGLGGPGVAGRAAPPEVRAARIRDLTRWNDRPGRSREDVLRLLDLAIARAIMEAAHTPPATVPGERSNA
jgi:hypothetical protein